MLNIAKDVGFSGVELSVSEDGEMAHTQALSNLRSISQEATARSLELHSVSTVLHWMYPLSSVDRKMREQALKIGSFMIKAASTVGADTVLIVPGIADPKVPYRDTYHIAQQSLHTLSQTASELGVRIGVENVWNRFLQGPLEMLRFIEEIDSPFVGAYFDVGNVMAMGHPQHWIQVLGGHIVKVHVKDFVHQVGNIHGFTYLLHGDVPWIEVVRELKAIGYDNYLTAELSPADAFTDRLIREVFESLTAIVEEDA